MTEARKLIKENKEIDIIDLFVEILLHWKGLIIATLIGGLLLGGYSIYSSYKNNKAALAAKVAEEKAQLKFQHDIEYYQNEMDRNARLKEEFEKILSAKDTAGANLILTYYEELLNHQRYMESSVLMNVDASNMPVGLVSLRVGTSEDVVFEFKNSYSDALISYDMYKYLKEKLGYGNEISELVLWSDVNDKTETRFEIESREDEEGPSENQKPGSFVLTYYFYAASEENCEALVTAFIEYANSKAEDYAKVFGPVEVTVLDRSVTTIYDFDVEKMQKTALDLRTKYQNDITTGYDALSDEGKEYFDLVSNQKKAESELENLEDISSISVKEIPPVTVSKKKLAIGLVGGFFAYALIVCIVYVLSGKVKDSDDFGSSFGVNQLGKIYYDSKPGKRFSAFDKVIYSLKRRGRKKVSPDEAASIIAVNTSITASKHEIKKLGLITADEGDALTGKIVDAFKSENIESIILSEFPYNGKEVSALKDIDAAILIAKPGISRYDEIWDVIEVLDNQEVKILGGIMG